MPHVWTATAGIDGSPVKDEGSLWRVAERTLDVKRTPEQRALILRELTPRELFRGCRQRRGALAARDNEGNSHNISFGGADGEVPPPGVATPSPAK